MVLKLYNKNAAYRWPCVFSLLGHGILLAMLMVSLPAKTFRAEQSAAEPAPQSVVHATTVDAAVLQEHIQAIQAESVAKQRQAEQQQQRRLQEAEDRRLAQIKIEQKKLDQKKREADANQKKQQQLASQKKKLKALQDQLLQNLLSKERQQLSVEQKKAVKAGVEKVAVNQTSVVNPGEIEKYRAAILERIQNNWHPPQQNATLSCALLVHLAAGGVVTSVDLVRSSGDAVLDRSAEAAVYKSSPLPVPLDAAVFNEFRNFRIKMSPQDINAGINT